MEKYGVVMDKDKTKTAHSKPTCPMCGRTVSHSNEKGVPYCIQCGTEPFEPRSTSNSGKQKR